VGHGFVIRLVVISPAGTPRRRENRVGLPADAGSFWDLSPRANLAGSTRTARPAPTSASWRPSANALDRLDVAAGLAGRDCVTAPGRGHLDHVAERLLREVSHASTHQAGAADRADPQVISAAFQVFRYFGHCSSIEHAPPARETRAAFGSTAWQRQVVTGGGQPSPRPGVPPGLMAIGSNRERVVSDDFACFPSLTVAGRWRGALLGLAGITCPGRCRCRAGRSRSAPARRLGAPAGPGSM